LNKILLASLGAVLIVAGFQSAEAIPLSGQQPDGDLTSAEPLLAGGTVIDFEDGAVASTNSPIILGDVTITTIDGNQHTISSDFAGVFNVRDTFCLNNVFVSPKTLQWRFEFTTPVDGFAFLWGAADSPWELKAFDDGGNLIETFVINPTGSSNNGDYFGIAASGIKSFTLISLGGFDGVLFDNLTFIDSNNEVIGGEIIPIESTSLILAGTQSFSWMIPVTLSVLGIGLFVASRKCNN
jgi:hypothetical protein